MYVTEAMISKHGRDDEKRSDMEKPSKMMMELEECMALN